MEDSAKALAKQYEVTKKNFEKSETANQDGDQNSASANAGSVTGQKAAATGHDHHDHDHDHLDGHGHGDHHGHSHGGFYENRMRAGKGSVPAIPTPTGSNPDGSATKP